MYKLPERMLKFRKDSGLSQENAAKAIGIAFRSYRRYESGEREPDASTLILLADHYNTTIDFLVGRSDER